MDDAPERNWRRRVPDSVWQLLLVAAITVPFIMFQLDGEPRELVVNWLIAPLFLGFTVFVTIGLLGVVLSFFTPPR